LGEESFKILSASAGTGKTYRLTKAYLLLLLKDNSLQNFRSLLAITFTNKAVAEMKNRILQSLFSFSSGDFLQDENSLFNELSKQLNLSEPELRQRSKKVLKTLLNNYAFFDVSTIDHFNHRIIRTFAKDLSISQNFEVELDTELVLNKAVNKVLAKAGKDEQLTSIFVDFALEKIDEGKSWNIGYDLNEIGKLVFQENHYQHLKSIQAKNIGDFLTLNKTIKEHIATETAAMRKNAKASLDLIRSVGLISSDFKGGYLPKFLQQVVENPLKIDYKATWKNNFNDAELYNKTLDQAKKDCIDNLRPQLDSQFNKIRTKFHKISFLGRLRKSIVPLAVISEIQKEIEVLKTDDSFLTINEFNELISKEIKKQPIPYIYERLGERYQHYFIDEFQDTSTLQWENLVPLIGHALEGTDIRGQQGSLLLVGDVKQAIYRWRGGEPRQFVDLIYNNKNPFTIAPSLENLTKNWRSYNEIINFNNSFFSFTSNKLSSEENQKIYKDGNQQETNEKRGGFVKISFLPNEKNEAINPHCEKVLKSITTIVEAKYNYAEICVLVRNKNNEKKLAEYLIKKQIPVISSEGLLLMNNEVVTFLISCIEFILNPAEKEYAFAILEFLFKDSSKKHDAISKHLNDVSGFLKTSYNLNLEQLKFLDILSVCETLIARFEITVYADAFVLAFLDEVHEYEKTKSNGLYGFVTFWSLKKDKLSLPIPEKIDAVKVMTIHKSKGLEFPFVIFPFADDIINDNKKQNDIWVPVKPENHSGFSELMVTNNKHLPYYSEIAAKVHQEENEKSVLDDFNVLYVALTRAIYGLYIITTKQKENSKQTSYASYFNDYVRAQGYVLDSFEEISFGALETNKNPSVQKDTLAISYLKSKNAIECFEIAYRKNSKTANETIAYGNLIHSLLGDIYHESDISLAISKHLQNGSLQQEDAKSVEGLLKKVVQHNSLKNFFAKDVISKNEINILTNDGDTSRPDKLVFDKNKVSILDYKTGAPEENHKLQLIHYSEILTKMGYEVSNRILVYIDKEINTIVF
jgi:ATP-dependent exoDNAse (exonuclease V) beta subunit